MYVGVVGRRTCLHFLVLAKGGHLQERVNDDLDSVVAWAGQQPDVDISRLAVMGFCYGGGKAIRYSATRGNAAATVVFYGSPVSFPNRLLL